MCLGAPGKIVSIDGLVAVVDFFGVQKQVHLHIVDEPVVPGDYILNHVGYAIRKIPQEDIEATLAMYAELISGAPGDLMRQDVEGEAGPTGLAETGIGPPFSPSGVEGLLDGGPHSEPTKPLVPRPARDRGERGRGSINPLGDTGDGLLPPVSSDSAGGERR